MIHGHIDMAIDSIMDRWDDEAMITSMRRSSIIDS